MIPETNTWICDHCGETIKRPSDGWVQWLRIYDPVEDRATHSKDLQLVHASFASPGYPRRSCIYNDQRIGADATTADLPLDSFTGPDGLMTLLSFIKHDFKKPDEVIEIIKRIFIPGYEHARLHLDAAINNGVYEPNTPEGFPHQSDMKRVLAWLEDEKSR